MAFAVRGGQSPEVILHVDCGSKYTAGIPGSLPAVRHAAVHARGPGSVLDNAVVKSWHSILEWEQPVWLEALSNTFSHLNVFS